MYYEWRRQTQCVVINFVTWPWPWWYVVRCGHNVRDPYYSSDGEESFFYSYAALSWSAK